MELHAVEGLPWEDIDYDPYYDEYGEPEGCDYWWDEYDYYNDVDAGEEEPE